jgi:hypothetical protein
MKTNKLILAAALIGTFSLSAAHAGVRFGFSIGLPSPAPVFVTAPVTPVYVTVPAPVYVAPSVVVAPAAPVVVSTPPCPGVGYVWTAGYYTYAGYNRVWVPGNWQYRPATVGYARGHDRGHDHNYGWRR